MPSTSRHADVAMGDPRAGAAPLGVGLGGRIMSCARAINRVGKAPRNPTPAQAAVIRRGLGHHLCHGNTDPHRPDDVLWRRRRCPGTEAEPAWHLYRGRSLLCRTATRRYGQPIRHHRRRAGTTCAVMPGGYFPTAAIPANWLFRACPWLGWARARPNAAVKSKTSDAPSYSTPRALRVSSATIGGLKVTCIDVRRGLPRSSRLPANRSRTRRHGRLAPHRAQPF